MYRQKSFENDINTLYLVATPIGNMSEFSFRAIDILKSVDIIACEDTRTTMTLLNHYNIVTPLISHHSHNEESSVLGIMKLLDSGKNVALVSDAGYPLISDPGNLLVSTCIKSGYNVVPVSGPSAFVNALVSSGIITQPFLFHGFLPSTNKQLRRILKEYQHFSYTMIFYVSVHKLTSALEEMIKVFGDREACLAREMTKKHEEFLRGKLSEILDVATELKGEFVLIVKGNPHEKEADIAEIDVSTLIDELVEQGFSASQAIKEIAKKHNLSKNEVYDKYHHTS